MRQFAARGEEFSARGVSLVRVFHSPVPALAALEPLARGAPLTVVADPRRDTYRAWGVGSSALSLLRPAAWSRAREAARGGHRPRWRDALRDGIGVSPADFLVAAGGRLARVRYGRHFTDSLAVDAALEWIDELAARSAADAFG